MTTLASTATAHRVAAPAEEGSVVTHVGGSSAEGASVESPLTRANTASTSYHSGRRTGSAITTARETSDQKQQPHSARQRCVEHQDGTFSSSSSSSSSSLSSSTSPSRFIAAHPNIVQLKAYYFTGNAHMDDYYLHLILSYMPMDLQKARRHGLAALHLNSGRAEADQLMWARIILFQLARALAFLHDRHVCHRDVKPANILIDPATGKIQLCDFGSAKQILHPLIEKNVSYICSRFYRAPELLFGALHYGCEVDLWSFGVVAAELLRPRGRSLFRGCSTVDQMAEIFKVLGAPSTQEMYSLNPQCAEAMLETHRMCYPSTAATAAPSTAYPNSTTTRTMTTTTGVGNDMSTHHASAAVRAGLASETKATGSVVSIATAPNADTASRSRVSSSMFSDTPTASTSKSNTDNHNSIDEVGVDQPDASRTRTTGHTRDNAPDTNRGPLHDDSTQSDVNDTSDGGTHAHSNHGDYSSSSASMAYTDYYDVLKIRAMRWSDVLMPGAPPEAVDLISHVLCYVPQKRMPAARIVEHPFFAPLFRGRGADAESNHDASGPRDDRTSGVLHTDEESGDAVGDRTERDGDEQRLKLPGGDAFLPVEMFMLTEAESHIYSTELQKKMHSMVRCLRSAEHRQM